MKRFFNVASMAIAVVTLTVAACGGGQEATQTQAPTEAHTEEEEHAEEAASEGLQLYRSVGCAGCHGDEGEGGVGPALAGHTPEQVERQVRTPKGDVMPAYDQEELSDAQLQEIVGWIESLGPAGAAHMHDEDEAHMMEGELAGAHLRLAYFAALDGNAHDAEHHLEDLLTLLEDEHAKEQAEAVLAGVQEDADPHELAHELEHLMEDLSPEVVSVERPEFHLQLVLDNLTLERADAAAHHLEHYAELVEDPDRAAEAEELKEHLEQGEVHEVEETVRAWLSGEEPSHQD